MWLCAEFDTYDLRIYFLDGTKPPIGSHTDRETLAMLRKCREYKFFIPLKSQGFHYELQSLRTSFEFLLPNEFIIDHYVPLSLR